MTAAVRRYHANDSDTPLVRLNRINEGGAVIYAKLEAFNPSQASKTESPSR